MKSEMRYAKVVEWSEEDQCFVGSAPGLFYGGCHGDDERQVINDLCRIVDDVVALYQAEGKPLPKPNSGASTGDTLPGTCAQAIAALSRPRTTSWRLGPLGSPGRWVIGALLERPETAWHDVRKATRFTVGSFSTNR
jgi:predicted RNase H-like HicB family nuclease